MTPVDASRFLAQSQSRLSFAPPDERRQHSDRGRRQNQGTWRSATASRLNTQRGTNPYQPTSSQLSGFPFASRANPQQAPLFFSATDEFREENDEEEHEREIADFYALQKSRRHLGESDLKESSEPGSESSVNGNDHDDDREGGYGRGGGIRSSWRGGVTSGRGRGPHMEDLTESPELPAYDTRSTTSGASRSKMSDIRLEDTMRSEPDDEPPEDLMQDPPVQRFRTSIHHSNDRGGLLGDYPPSEPEHESIPDVVPQPSSERPKHDAFWGESQG